MDSCPEFPMHTSESGFSPLTTCPAPVEVSCPALVEVSCPASAEALATDFVLKSESSTCVVEGEYLSGLLGSVMGGAVIEARVVVACTDRERARALLESDVETPREQAAALAAGGAAAPPPCPVQGEVSTSVYTGYNPYLYTHGDLHGLPPRSEEFQEHKSAVPNLLRCQRHVLVAGWAFGSVIMGSITLGGLYLLLQQLLQG